MATNLLHADITEQILAAFYAVYNALGYGFLEKVYRNAMAIELAERSVEVITEAPILVYYHGRAAGEYYADLLVANKVIVELKATKTIAPEHEAQVLNYLKATLYEVGLLLNFGPQATKKRFVYPNHRKGKMTWVSQ
jgi:GxxExxY protein